VLDDLGSAEHLSDTKVFAMLVNRMGFKRAVRKHKPTGVWLWMSSKGRLSVWKSGGSLHYSPDFGALGSEPARQGYWYEVADGYCPSGQTPKREPPAFVPPTLFTQHRGIWMDPTSGQITIR
jgi:hypothetical protein